MRANEDQISMFDHVLPSGRTSSGRSHRTAARTSGQSSKSSAGSQTRRYQFLDLRTDGGNRQERSWETGGRLHGEPMTRNTGESPSVDVESHLSQILEASPHPKYSLSAKACLGILNRAEKRGKVLPEILKAALTQQAQMELTASKVTVSTELTPQDATEKDGRRM